MKKATLIGSSNQTLKALTKAAKKKKRRARMTLKTTEKLRLIKKKICQRIKKVKRVPKKKRRRKR